MTPKPMDIKTQGNTRLLNYHHLDVRCTFLRQLLIKIQLPSFAYKKFFSVSYYLVEHCMYKLHVLLKLKNK